MPKLEFSLVLAISAAVAALLIAIYSGAYAFHHITPT